MFMHRPSFKSSRRSPASGRLRPAPTPAPRPIYHRAIDIVGRPANRILFIDDRAANAQAARDAGMQAIQFLGEDQLRAQFRELEIL